MSLLGFELYVKNEYRLGPKLLKFTEYRVSSISI